MEELVKAILNSNQMTPEEKLYHVMTIINVTNGKSHNVANGLYLTTVGDEDNLDLQLWYRNEDQYGQTDHGNTGYSHEQILDLMHRDFLARDREGVIKR